MLHLGQPQPTRIITLCNEYSDPVRIDRPLYPTSKPTITYLTEPGKLLAGGKPRRKHRTATQESPRGATVSTPAASASSRFSELKYVVTNRPNSNNYHVYQTRQPTASQPFATQPLATQKTSEFNQSSSMPELRAYGKPGGQIHRPWRRNASEHGFQPGHPGMAQRWLLVCSSVVHSAPRPNRYST